MIIRPIVLEDAEQLLDLQNKIDESGFMLFEPGERKTTVEQQKKWLENLLSEEKSIIITAEVNDQLVGYLVALGGKVNRKRHSAYLVLGVLEEYQGQGIATSLFQHLFTWAKRKEITRLELTVIKDNHKALNLYKKMGFVIEGEKVHSLMINGEPRNEYYMAKYFSY